jgi:hypothetical protein
MDKRLYHKFERLLGLFELVSRFYVLNYGLFMPIPTYSKKIYTLFHLLCTISIRISYFSLKIDSFKETVYRKSFKGIVSPDWKGLQMFSLDRFEV